MWSIRCVQQCGIESDKHYTYLDWTDLTCRAGRSVHMRFLD
jgi:hypothetical protein